MYSMANLLNDFNILKTLHVDKAGYKYYDRMTD